MNMFWQKKKNERTLKLCLAQKEYSTLQVFGSCTCNFFGIIYLLYNLKNCVKIPIVGTIFTK